MFKTHEQCDPLSLNNSAGRAISLASTAIDASRLINNILVIPSGNSANRASCCTSTTHYASIIHYMSHGHNLRNSHYLKHTLHTGIYQIPMFVL